MADRKQFNTVADQGAIPPNSWEFFPHNFIAWSAQVVIFINYRRMATDLSMHTIT